MQMELYMQIKKERKSMQIEIFQIIGILITVIIDIGFFLSISLFTKY